MELVGSGPAAEDFGIARLSAAGRLDPYPLYARLRKQPGLVYSPALDLWLLSRHQDVLSALRAPLLFSSEQALRSPRARPPEVQTFLEANGYSPRLPLLTTDPPAHNRLRNLIAKAFTPQRVAALEPRIRAQIDALLAHTPVAEPDDAVTRLGIPLPMRVMCAMIGVPEQDIPHVKEYCEASAQFVTGQFTLAEELACAEKVVEYRRYVRRLIAAQQHQSSPTLISALLAARDQEAEVAKLSHEEVVGLCIVFIFAGHQTTTDLLANSLLHLLPRPALWQALAQDPELCARAVEEVLRFDAPVQGMMRTVTAATEIAGTALPAQARIFALFGAANRDEAVFGEPDHFDPTRKHIDPHAGQHLAFGRGIHFCVGAALARLEARLLLAELSRRFPRAQLVDDTALPYPANLIHRAPQQLRVRWQNP